jgi:hypothetical protein
MVDFAKLNREREAERQRLAALSPQQRAQEEAARQAAREEARQREEDKVLFGDRPRRALSCTLVDGPRFDSRDESKRVSAINERGRLTVVFKGSRAEWSEDQDLFFNRAMLGTEREETGNSEVPARLTGVFQSRYFRNGAGERQQAWDFVVEEAEIAYKGQTMRFGRPCLEQGREDSMQEKARPRAPDSLIE